MTTRVELLEMLRNGESSSVEFKRDDIQNIDLAKELVAFSNFEGGAVLLGVEDDGNVGGITRDDLEEWVMNLCRDKIRPAIVPSFEIIRDVEPGKDVAVVRVPRSEDIESLWHNNRNTYFTRVGTTNREPSTEELSRLFQRRGAFSAEKRPVPRATIADLDQRRLKEYFKNIREQDVPADNDETGWQRLLVNTEIMAAEGVTQAGLLLFGRNPNRHLAHAGIQAAAFPGQEKDYAMNETSQIRGPMTPLRDEQRNIVEAGLVEQAMAFVTRNIRITAQLEIGGRRVDRWEYPLDAVREAIVNALVHRDYQLTGTDIELCIYSDRIEVVSPGRLPNGVTTDGMRVGCRSARNELIRDTMRDYGYLERMGLGVPRKIIKGMKEHNGTDPELVDKWERFTVRLFSGD